MKRVLKGDKTLRQVEFKGESFEVVIGDATYEKERKGEYILYKFKKDTYEYQLQVRETEKCFIYEIEREYKPSEIVDRCPITIDLNDFYNLGFEEAIQFESEQEIAIGFVKEDKVYIPIKEHVAIMECVVINKEELSDNDYEITSCSIDGNIGYLGMTDNDLDLKNIIKFRERKSSNICYVSKNMYKIATHNNDVYIVKEDREVVRISKYTVGEKDIYTIKKVDSIPEEATIVRERYVSKKKTNGITDTMIDPFKWLKY